MPFCLAVATFAPFGWWFSHVRSMVLEDEGGDGENEGHTMVTVGKSYEKQTLTGGPDKTEYLPKKSTFCQSKYMGR